VADGVSLLLFAGGALELTESLFFMASGSTAALAVAVTLLGPLGCGVERGESRRLGWGGALAVAAFAAFAHVGLLSLQRGELVGWLARGLPILVLALVAIRIGARFDRGEAGWRAAVRRGPALGGTPLAGRIAALRLPRPLAWLCLPLLPVELALRGLSAAAILGYQLTLSRLMPSACRYEPSCSRYGFRAYLCHGTLRGSLLTLVRLIRCSPIGNGGYDPVPEERVSVLPWRRT
jgi:putative membrane protein insertion efficiency factor